jgi:undecaprenyl-diphosphatase
MWFQAALQGIVQGLTEFLPVSSSAHLILARAFFGWDDQAFGTAFDVAVHVGTLLAVVLYFAPELAQLARAVPRILAPQADASARQLRLLVVGTLPLVPVGLLYTDQVEQAVRTPGVAAVMLGVGGACLWLADRRGSRERSEDALTLPQAFGLGLAQAAALVPGVSRSGATMTVALLFGLRREAAARLSFLLGVPAILAAASLTLVDALDAGLPPGATPVFLVGVVTSGVVGYLTVKYFLRYVSANSLGGFAYYRFVLAGATGLWLLLA